MGVRIRTGLQSPRACPGESSTFARDRPDRAESTKNLRTLCLIPVGSHLIMFWFCARVTLPRCPCPTLSCPPTSSCLMLPSSVGGMFFHLENMHGSSAGREKRWTAKRYCLLATSRHGYRVSCFLVPGRKVKAPVTTKINRRKSPNPTSSAVPCSTLLWPALPLSHVHHS